jgi:hypothetical protein
MLLSDLKLGRSRIRLEVSVIVAVIVVVHYLNNLAAQFLAIFAQVGASVVSIADSPHALNGKGAR